MPAERRNCPRARFKLQSVVAPLALLAGCAAQTATYQPRPDPTTPDSALVVLHVTGESGLRAGTPLGWQQFAATVEPADAEQYGIIVEGAPAPTSMLDRGIRIARPKYEDIAPLHIYHDNHGLHLSNQPCTEYNLDPGQCVQIAGFLPPASDQSVAASLTAPPVEISALILSAEQIPTGLHPHPKTPDVIYLAAPPGDYRAFRGGPVALVRPGDAPCLIAIVVEQLQDSPERGAILTAMPLSRWLP